MICDELMIAKMACHFLDQDLRGVTSWLMRFMKPQTVNWGTSPSSPCRWVDVKNVELAGLAVHQKGLQQESEQMGSFTF